MIIKFNLFPLIMKISILYLEMPKINKMAKKMPFDRGWRIGMGGKEVGTC